MSDERVLYAIPEGIAQMRADKALATHFSELSRELIQKAFDAGHVWIEGKPIKKSHAVGHGDCLEIKLPKIPKTIIKPVDLPLSILFEDNDIVIVNKRSGQIVHPGSGTGEDTLVHALLHHTGGQLSQLAGAARPGVVHRLDKETSGVVIFAKTDKAYFRLIKVFSEREIHKEYTTLVYGVPRLLAGSIKESIDRHRVNRVKMAVSQTGKPAHTDWEITEKFPLQQTSLLQCVIHTGRTHQIRVHLSWLGHPIVGDKLYGWKVPSIKEYRPNVDRIMLHASKIKFEHPIKKKLMEIEAPLPDDFKNVLKNLQEREKDLNSFIKQPYRSR